MNNKEINEKILAKEIKIRTEYDYSNIVVEVQSVSI